MGTDVGIGVRRVEETGATRAGGRGAPALPGEPATACEVVAAAPFQRRAVLKNLVDPPVVSVAMRGALGITTCLSDRFRATRTVNRRTRSAEGAFGQVFVYGPAEDVVVAAEGRVRLVQLRFETARLEAIAIEDHDLQLDADGLASVGAAVDMRLAGLVCAALSGQSPWAETERLVAATLAERADRRRSLRTYRGGLSPTAQRRVADHVEDRLAEVTLASMADAAALSPFHFARAFRTSTGTTPWRYVVERRVARAATLMERGCDDLSSIAAATGFSTPSHLGRTVREVLSTTPARLRTIMRAPSLLIGS